MNIQSQHFNTKTDTEISRKIVWDNAKVNDFKNSLSNEHAYIEGLTTDVSNEPIDDVVKNFSNFLHDKAFDIFGKTYNTNKTNSRQKVNKKWFDENCKNAKHEFTRARNLFNRDKNDQSRLNFTHARTKYNRVKNKAQKNFKRKEGNRLNEIAKKDSKKFWKHIKKSYKKNNRYILYIIKRRNNYTIILKRYSVSKPNRMQIPNRIMTITRTTISWTQNLQQQSYETQYFHKKIISRPAWIVYLAKLLRHHFLSSHHSYSTCTTKCIIMENIPTHGARVLYIQYSRKAT